MDPIQEVTTLERKLALKAQTKRIPINGSIELLPLCNMKCDMCYVRLSKEEMDKQGRLRTWEEWLEIGRQMKESGTLFLLLTGGEPLMYPDFRKLYLGLRNLGMAITINTNATLLNEDWSSFLENTNRGESTSLYTVQMKMLIEISVIIQKVLKKR